PPTVVAQKAPPGSKWRWLTLPGASPSVSEYERVLPSLKYASPPSTNPSQRPPLDGSLSTTEAKSFRPRLAQGNCSTSFPSRKCRRQGKTELTQSSSPLPVIDHAYPLGTPLT